MSEIYEIMCYGVVLFVINVSFFDLLKNVNINLKNVYNIKVLLRKFLQNKPKHFEINC